MLQVSKVVGSKWIEVGLSLVFAGRLEEEYPTVVASRGSLYSVVGPFQEVQGWRRTLQPLVLPHSPTLNFRERPYNRVETGLRGYNSWGSRLPDVGGEVKRDTANSTVQLMAAPCADLFLLNVFIIFGTDVDLFSI